MIAFADVLLGTLWTDLTLAQQEEIFSLYIGQTGRSEADGAYDCQYGSLRLLAWLTEGWPDSQVPRSVGSHGRKVTRSGQQGAVTENDADLGWLGYLEFVRKDTQRHVTVYN